MHVPVQKARDFDLPNQRPSNLGCYSGTSTSSDTWYPGTCPCNVLHKRLEATQKQWLFENKLIKLVLRFF